MIIPYAAYLLTLTLASPAPDVPDWTALARGIEYRRFVLEESPTFGDGYLHVVRITPGRVKLKTMTLEDGGGRERTAAEWRAHGDFSAVINAGMFETDRRTHTGYLRIGERPNNKKWVRSYNSMLVIGPEDPADPPFDLIDLGPGQSAKDFAHYHTASQNLRLIKAPGRNTWQDRGQRWSEAAIAIDREGRLLFLFARSPYSMRSFNQKLLALPLGIVRAMHAEGGPEASLSLKGPNLELNLSGSYETGFNENDDNQEQWTLPNIIGVKPS